MRIETKNYLKAGIFLTVILLTNFGCNFNFSVGKPKQPTNEEVQKLAKETMADFTESLEKDDFEIIRKKASRDFQRQFSAEKIKDSFDYFVERKSIAVPVFQEIQDTQPKFDPTPAMTETGEKYVLQTRGNFFTQDRTVNFHFEYLREDGEWKLIKIEIKV